MSDFLESINKFLGISDVQFVGLLTALAFILSWPIGRFFFKKFPYSDMNNSGEGIGSYCNVVGILYAIVMGYVLVNVYESFSEANLAVETESALLVDILRDAEGLPRAEGLKLRIATLRYIESVTSKEWEHMVKFGFSHPDTFDRFADMYHLIRSVRCDNDEQRVFLAEILNRLNELSTTRHKRIVASTSRVPNILWGMMIIVGLVTLSLCIFFPVENERLRGLFLANTAAVMTFTTLLIYVMDRPYSGSLGIKPESIVHIIYTVKAKGIDKITPDLKLSPELIDSIRDMRKLIEKIAPGEPPAGSRSRALPSMPR